MDDLVRRFSTFRLITFRRVRFAANDVGPNEEILEAIPPVRPPTPGPGHELPARDKPRCNPKRHRP